MKTSYSILIIGLLTIIHHAVMAGNNYPVSFVKNDSVSFVDNPIYGDGSKFEGWSEQQMKDYEDSLINTLYPSTEIRTLESIPRQINDTPLKTASVSLISNPHVPDLEYVDTEREDFIPGVIPFSSGVTPTGARTYDIPIEVYPGINGFQPKLSISYNSQRPNSIMGPGWYISGIPNITRSGKNMYFDNTTAGIAMDLSDSFILDGVRLIKIGTYTDHIQYRSEIGNIFVKGYYSGKVMEHFEVFYPDGNKGVFGISGNKENRAEYPIRTLSDLHGNTIEYTYNTTGFERIRKITYNTSAEVEFVYTSRPSPLVSFKGGEKIVENICLYDIVIKFDSNPIATYILGYKTFGNLPLLDWISIAHEEKEYNPIRVYYGEGKTDDGWYSSTTQLFEWYAMDEPNSVKVLRGRFDYVAGVDGLISFPNQPSYWRHSSGHELRFDNKYKGDEQILLCMGLSTDLERPVKLYTGEGFIDILCADLTGNQEENIIKINNTVQDGNDKVTFTTYQSNIISGVSTRHTRTFSFPTAIYDPVGGKSVHPKFYYSGDFNGDGKMEVLALSSNRPLGLSAYTSKCYIFDLENNKLLYQGHLLDYNVVFVGNQMSDETAAFNETDKLFAMDYDGDGKTDIVHINESGTHVYTFDVSDGNLSPRKVATYTVISRNSLVNRIILGGDFNADGLFDLLVSPDTTSDFIEWMVHYSKGDGTFDAKNFYPITSTSSEFGGFITQDVNGDGMCDLINHWGTGFGVFLGKSNVPEGNNRYVNAVMGYPEEKSILVQANINSQNRFSQLVSLKNGMATKYTYKTDVGMESLLTGISNNLGSIEKTSYRRIDANSTSDDFYSKGSDASFPYLDLLEPLPVVETTETYLDGIPDDYIQYSYENAVFHRQGLGFRGFGTIRKRNKRGHVETSIYDPYKYGLPKSVKSTFAETVYNFSTKEAPNKILTITLDKKVETQILKGNTLTSTYQYDDFGYPVKETCEYSDGFKTVTDKTYSHVTSVGDGYNLGFQTKENRTSTNGSDSYSESFYISGHNKRKPLKIIKEINGNQASEEAYSYDDKGNKISESVKPYGSSQPLKKTFAYNTLGQLTKETDVLGLTTEYSYNNYGKVSTEKNARGGITKYEYDLFRRPVSKILPDNTLESIGYSWVTDGKNGIYKITKTATGQPEVAEYHDAFDRVIMTSETRFDGTVLNSYRRYDQYGNLAFESIPCTETAEQVGTTYSYDVYNRLISATGPGTKEISFSYSGNTTTVDEDGTVITHTYNPRGELIKVKDLGGEVTYNLAPDGNPISIDNEGVATKFVYDGFRRRLSLTDPSLGTSTWTYDDAGNVLSETDANGKSITYEYDTFNRITKRETPEFTSTYKYGSFGEITNVSSSNGTYTTLTYDDIGRPEKVIEQGGGRMFFRKEYTYSDGNIESVSYFSTNGKLGKESFLYSNGHLSKVIFNDTVIIFKLNKENEYGRVSSVTSGNLARAYKFTPSGCPLERKVYYGDNTLQYNAYSFKTQENNLASRTDMLRNKKESFGYDGLNRLVTYGNDTATYADNGNLLSRSEVGAFSYGNSRRPYRLSSVIQTGERIPLRSQTVTYTSFSRPATIVENSYKAEFTYNADFDRVKMVVSSSKASTKTMYYLGKNYESVFIGTSTVPEERLYLGGDYYDAPAVLVKKGSKTSLYYLLRDYLGSITEVVDTEGNVMQKLSYDAWGNLRNPDTHAVYKSGEEPKLMFGRGFTGHEHLQQYGLINMNARLYDPTLGRFLSPDPYVQNPESTQNFNRYSYCLNNPLCYVDEDGEFFFAAIAIAAVIAGVTNVAVHWKEIKATGGWKGFWKGAGYFGIGALAGGAGTAAGIAILPLMAPAITSAVGITSAQFTACVLYTYPSPRDKA